MAGTYGEREHRMVLPPLLEDMRAVYAGYVESDQQRLLSKLYREEPRRFMGQLAAMEKAYQEQLGKMGPVPKEERGEGGTDEGTDEGTERVAELMGEEWGKVEGAL